MLRLSFHILLFYGMAFYHIQSMVFFLLIMHALIVLIDNYIDETVLAMLDKRGKDVTAKVYTKNISRQLSLDFDKHNAQYTPIEVEQFDRAHDRFLCIDDTVYLIGASIKDLGKKWFGFTKIDGWTTDELLSKM